MTLLEYHATLYEYEIAYHRALTTFAGASRSWTMQMGTDGPASPSAAQLQQFGVSFGTVDRRILQADVRTVGIVTFEQTRIA